MGVTLRDYQEDALGRMKNGCILNGGVGSGKSRTSLAYYYTKFGGRINTKDYVKMINPKDLYIITTAKKRDNLEWEEELLPFHLFTDEKTNTYKNKVVIDSWNNIKKYIDVQDAFFIFDEQRVIGYGAWVKAFLKITKKNQWILLTATPGDTWMDYIPVFIANHFYDNKTDFMRQHCVLSRFTKYQKVERYIYTKKLVDLRNSILINMDFERSTIPHHEYIITEYDREKYKFITKNRWDPDKNEPINSASEFCACLRKVVNTDISKQMHLMNVIERHDKVIIFYNYNYELDILRKLFTGIRPCAEWNGQKHEDIPNTSSWVYLVQYTAGCEGWNCITTDTIIFFSQNYSYRVMKQAAGRIDRMNTSFVDLYYYHFITESSIDKNIMRALKHKKDFNVLGFYLEKPRKIIKDTDQITMDI